MPTRDSPGHLRPAGGTAPRLASSWPAGPLWRQAPVVLLTLGGFLLRAYALGAKDLRGDESFAATFAAQPLGIIWTALGLSEPHPPLYYALLHWMIALAGPSNYSLRYLSVLFGTLAIPALAVAAHRAFDRRAAWLTALLAAANPLLVWQAQDARMYAPLVGFCAVALAGSLALLADGRRRQLLAAVLGGAGGALLTHFYGVFVVAGLVGGLLLVGAAVHRRGRTRSADQRFLRLVALLLALEILLVALPLLLHSRQALSGHPPFARLSLPALLESIGQTVAGGFTLPIPLRRPAGVFAGLLALAGLAVAWRGHCRAVLLIGASMLVPLAGLACLEVVDPAYQPAYAAVLVPAWLLAVAGLAAPRLLRAWVGVAPAVLLLGLLAEQSLTTDAQSAKNLTFQQAANLLVRQGQPGDLIMTNYPDPTLAWAYRRQDGGQLPVLLEPAAMPADPAALDRTMIGLGDRYDRIWFWTLRTAAWDPQHATEIWLDRHTLPLATKRAGNVTLRLFETPRGFLAHTAPLPAVTFDGQLRLRGASWPASAVAPGSTVTVTLCWQAVSSPQGDYTAFVHLERGVVLAGQDDHPPVNGLNLTHTWLPGESFLDQYHVRVPANAVPGTYAVRVGFYPPATLQRLPVLNGTGATVGDALTIGQVTVR